jgi:hypothetical protein
VLLALLAVFNPSLDDFQKHVFSEITLIGYKHPNFSNQDYASIISENTERYNYVFFSIHAVHTPWPGHIKEFGKNAIYVGILGTFILVEYGETS